MLVNNIYNYKNPLNNQVIQPVISGDINILASQIGQAVQMPDSSRNYCIFNQKLVGDLVAKGQDAVPAVLEKLKTTNDEKVIAEGIYILGGMIHAGVKGIDKAYPVLSRFNNTTSPTVQSLLAGVYRKIQVPDAFGPLMKMMIRNSLLPACPYFDPSEEIGGAILDYLRNAGAQKLYTEIQKKEA